MFTIAVDQRRAVLWNAFSGVFTREDLAAMDEVGLVLLEAEGPLNCVFDFSAVEGTEISLAHIAVRGQRPRHEATLRRVIVATHPDILKLADAFAAAQALTGSPPPAVVRTVEEARQVLGVDGLRLRPVDIEWLRASLHADREAQQD